MGFKNLSRKKARKLVDYLDKIAVACRSNKDADRDNKFGGARAAHMHNVRRVGFAV